MNLEEAQRAFRKLAELGTPGSVTAMLVGVEYARLHQATPAQLLKLKNLLKQEIANNRIRREEIAAFEESASPRPVATPKVAPEPKPARKRKRKPKAKAKVKVAPAPKPVADPTKPKNKGGRPQKHKWDNAWLCSLADTKANIHQTAKELGVSRQALHARVQLALAERIDQAKAIQEQARRNVGPDHAKELWLIEIWTPKCGTVTLIKPFWTRAAADKFMEEQAHYYTKPPRIVRFVPEQEQPEQQLPKFDANDLQIDVLHGRGSMGSTPRRPHAVRVTHVPTGKQATGYHDVFVSAAKDHAMQQLSAMLKED